MDKLDKLIQKVGAVAAVKLVTLNIAADWRKLPRLQFIINYADHPFTVLGLDRKVLLD